MSIGSIRYKKQQLKERLPHKCSGQSLPRSLYQVFSCIVCFSPPGNSLKNDFLCMIWRWCWQQYGFYLLLYSNSCLNLFHRACMPGKPHTNFVLIQRFQVYFGYDFKFVNLASVVHVSIFLLCIMRYSCILHYVFFVSPFTKRKPLKIVTRQRLIVRWSY